VVQNDTPREGGNDDGDEWDPEPADLRDGETPDEDSHAARNARMIREARRKLDRYDSDEGDEGGSLNEAAIREQLDDAEDDIREFAEEEF